jgi:hypothetical protein
MRLARPDCHSDDGIVRAEIFLVDSRIRADGEALPPCAFATDGRVQQDALRTRVGVVIAQERRAVATFKFGLYAESPAEIDVMRLVDDAPERIAGGAVDALRGGPASALDAALPPVPLDAWLDTTLAPFSTLEPAWSIRDCQPQTSGRQVVVRRAICAIVMAPLTDETYMELQIAVGSIENGEDGIVWRPDEPKLVQAMIVNAEADDSLDVARLSELPAKLKVPKDEWPAIDLELLPGSITATAPVLRSGEPVTFRVTVRNRGSRDAPRAILLLQMAPCGEWEPWITASFVPSVPAGGSTEIVWTTRLPPGVAWAVAAIVELEFGRKPVGHSMEDTKNNHAELLLGRCLLP